MLILTRKKGQAITINDEIEIIITSIEGDQVKIGVNAPKHYKIYRSELLELIKSSNKEAAIPLDSIKQLGKWMAPPSKKI
jgi:carbon storage regulator